jgi:formate/nitrite transporter FocA (FNT family)
MPKPDTLANAIAKDPKSPVSSITEAQKVEERVAIAAKVVYEATNIIGTFLFALTIAKVHFLEASIQQSVLQTALAHIGPGFWITFVRAIFAGWLIALMVWMLPDAASSRVVVIILITYLIGISHLSHIIAGSASVFFLVASGHLSIADYVLRFFVPTLSGNIIGGTSLVAALAHAQVVGGKN